MPPEDRSEDVEVSLRDEIEAAVSATEEGFVEETPREESPAPERAQPEDAGEEAPANPEAAREEPSDASRRHEDDDARYPGLTAERAAKAPASWRPAAREGWADLPDSVRREVHRREMDIARGMQETAEARRVSERLQETFKPYAAVMDAEGVSDPMQAVQGLLKTAAGLRMGSATEKAMHVAGLIQHYGVDINTLDEVLSAKVSGKEPQSANDPVLSAVEERLRPVNDFMTQMQQRMQQAQQTRQQGVQQEIQQFAEQAEFLDDVRLDMADLMDTAARRGRQLGLQEAYDVACRMNPEVRRVMESRGMQQERATQNARVQQKVGLTNSSLRSRPAAPPTAPKTDGSIRADLEAAIDAAG